MATSQGTIGVSIHATDSASDVIRKINKELAALKTPAMEFNASLKGLANFTGLNNVANGFRSMLSTIKEATFSLARFIPMLGLITGGGIVAGLASAAMKTVQFARSMELAAYQTNTNVMRLQQMRKAAELAGDSGDALVETYKNIGQAMLSAQNGENNNVAMMNKAFGIKDNDSDDQVFQKLLPRLAKMNARIAQWVEQQYGILVPGMVLDARTGKYQQDLKGADKSPSLTDQQTKNADDLRRDFEEKRQQVEATIMGKLADMAPALTKSLDTLSDQIAKWIAEIKGTNTTRGSGDVQISNMPDEAWAANNNFWSGPNGSNKLHTDQPWTQRFSDSTSEFWNAFKSTPGNGANELHNTESWVTRFQNAIKDFIGAFKWTGGITDTTGSAWFPYSGNAGFGPLGGGGASPGIGPRASGSMDPSTASRAKTVHDKLMGAGITGMTDAIAWGFAGNSIQESNANPNGPAGDNGAAHGLMMWRNSADGGHRLDDYIGRFHRLPEQGNMDEAVANIKAELETTEAAAWRKIRAASGSAGEAGAAISQFYERPKDVIAEEQRRWALASQLAASNQGPGIGQPGASGQIVVDVRHSGTPAPGFSMNVRPSGPAFDQMPSGVAMPLFGP